MPEPSDASDAPAARKPHEPAPLPPQVTTPLLTLITQQSMDEDYLHVAERRGRGQLPSSGSRSRPHRTAAVVVAVFGVLVTTAAVQTAQDADVDRAIIILWFSFFFKLSDIVVDGNRETKYQKSKVLLEKGRSPGCGPD